MVMRLREGAFLSIDRLKQMAESVGPRVLVGRARPAEGDAVVSQQVVRPRHRMLLLTLLGTFGLLLTLVGIFSMTAYAVARRTREIGVRVAFGARPGQVVGVMIRDAAWPVAFGLVAGPLARHLLRHACCQEFSLPGRRHSRSGDSCRRSNVARRGGMFRGLVAGSPRSIGRSSNRAAGRVTHRRSELLVWPARDDWRVSVTLVPDAVPSRRSQHWRPPARSARRAGRS